jgi:hypothetical protein
VYFDGGLTMELEWEKQMRMISGRESALKFTILRLKHLMVMILRKAFLIMSFGLSPDEVNLT